MYRSIVMPGPRIKFGAGSCAGRPGIRASTSYTIEDADARDKPGQARHDKSGQSSPAAIAISCDPEPWYSAPEA